MDIKLTEIKKLLPIIVCFCISLILDGVMLTSSGNSINIELFPVVIIIICVIFISIKNRNCSAKTFIMNILKNIFLVIFGFLLSFIFMISNVIYNTIVLSLLYYICRILLGYENKDKIIVKIPIFDKFYDFEVKNIKLHLILKDMRVILMLIVFDVSLIYLYTDFLYFDIINYISSREINHLILFSIIILQVLILIIITDKIIKLEKIKLGISEVKKGKLDYKIQLEKDIIFDEIISNINEIGDTVNIAVENRVKSERMKNELITNVSHDLKTPLTAIINYISLMKKENISPDYINDYVKVLDKRANRLKILIEDLFEVSTIGSNSMELNLEKTDLSQLLTQTLVELEESIKESNLNFIINNIDKEIYSLIDGKKTFRVFENLISNIIKYSLEGTRVYIDLEEKEDNVIITFKNISKNIINFNKDEITERFVRGDLSRSTEGSGLGLSISKGIVESQNGNFDIDIIGDLFIVEVSFKILNE